MVENHFDLPLVFAAVEVSHLVVACLELRQGVRRVLKIAFELEVADVPRCIGFGRGVTDDQGIVVDRAPGVLA